MATELLEFSLKNMQHLLDDDLQCSQLIPRLIDQVKSIIDTIHLDLSDVSVPPNMSTNPIPQLEVISPRASQTSALLVIAPPTAPNLKAHLAQSSLNILTRSVPKLATNLSLINVQANPLTLISPPTSPSASRLRAAVEGRMSRDSDSHSTEGDRAETTQEAIIREARTIGKSYPKLLECANMNSSQDDFK